jgi:hypothetical protein
VQLQGCIYLICIPLQSVVSSVHAFTIQYGLTDPVLLRRTFCHCFVNLLKLWKI